MFGLGQWQDIEGIMDSMLACCRLSLVPTKQTDTHAIIIAMIHGISIFYLYMIYNYSHIIYIYI